MALMFYVGIAFSLVAVWALGRYNKTQERSAKYSALMLSFVAAALIGMPAFMTSHAILSF